MVLDVVVVPSGTKRGLYSVMGVFLLVPWDGLRNMFHNQQCFQIKEKGLKYRCYLKYKLRGDVNTYQHTDTRVDLRHSPSLCVKKGNSNRLGPGWSWCVYRCYVLHCGVLLGPRELLKHFVRANWWNIQMYSLFFRTQKEFSDLITNQKINIVGTENDLLCTPKTERWKHKIFPSNLTHNSSG